MYSISKNAMVDNPIIVVYNDYWGCAILPIKEKGVVNGI